MKRVIRRQPSGKFTIDVREFKPVRKEFRLTQSEKAYFAQIIASNNQVKKGEIVVGGKLLDL